MMALFNLSIFYDWPRCKKHPGHFYVRRKKWSSTEILRLTYLGISQENIAFSCGCARSTH